MAESWDGNLEIGSPSDESYHFERLYLEPTYDAFLCPLTKQVMRDPVTIESGQTFEREAIEKWFNECKANRRNPVCPLTQRELRSTELNPSIALRNTIEEWNARNEAAQLDMARRTLSLGSPETDILRVLHTLEHLCQKSKANTRVIRNAELIPMIIDVLKSTSRRVRRKALETLRAVVEDDTENKEIMAEGDTVRTIVKFLSHEQSKEREEAVALLFELSKSESLCEKIGSINGAILILVGMASSNSENLVTVEKAEQTLENLEKCESNVRQMAENGRLRPLMGLLLEGLRPHQVLPGAQPNSHAGLRPQMQPMASQPDGSMQFNQQKTRSLSMENSNPNQLSNGDQNTLESKGEVEGDKKVEDKEKVILDSREKLEYYRTKMQDLVLYKSRCDNRLNEITERALADKREAELLQKKYEEKYKQVAEIASKLTIEEAAFRDVQERKLELQQAITKMEQGGSADGILQVRADRIQSDLEELLKALTERCKKHGATVKSTALIELPHGWQPGIPEISAVWDEDWDKFEDEGFSFDVAVPATAKSTSHQKENSPTHSNSPDSMSNAEAKSEQLFSHGVSTLETESTYTHSEDESKSPQGSPAGQREFQSPSQEFSDDHFGKSFQTDAEANRSFDGSALGAFDNNDDVDSVWGFNVKDSEHDKHGGNYFFGSNDFGGSPVRSGSPAAESRYQKNSPFFEDSVPGSPLSRAGNSPRYSVGSGDPFESFSRYDSFTTHDRTSSPRRENLTRFDSISSTSGFDHSRGFSFDDSDPFGSTGPFKVSSESQTPKKTTDSWSAF